MASIGFQMNFVLSSIIYKALCDVTWPLWTRFPPPNPAVLCGPCLLTCTCITVPHPLMHRSLRACPDSSVLGKHCDGVRPCYPYSVLFLLCFPGSCVKTFLPLNCWSLALSDCAVRGGWINKIHNLPTCDPKESTGIIPLESWSEILGKFPPLWLYLVQSLNIHCVVRIRLSIHYAVLLHAAQW